MKNSFFIFIVSLNFFSYAHCIEHPEEITMEWLLSESGEDHVVCSAKIFEKLNTRNMMEFGLGYATKYFLDTCKRVISVEVVTNGYGPSRIQKFIQFYRDYSNWVPIAYFSGYQGDMTWAPYKYIGSNAVYIAGSYQCSTHLHYRSIDDFYLTELGEFISNLVKFNKIEVALIHPILFLRGDLVELCFKKIPIIIAHHTAPRAQGEKNDVFGFSRVQTPSEYEEIYIPTQLGTTVWILKKPEFESLIEEFSRLIP